MTHAQPTLSRTSVPGNPFRRLGRRLRLTGIGLSTGLLLTACASAPDAAPVRITDRGENAVSRWAELGAATINQPAAATGTPQERRPVLQHDMATLHLAMHRALGAAPPELHEEAVHAAGFTVLRSLFPQRSAAFQAAYDAALAALPQRPGRDAALRVGTEAATRVVADRRDDGRWATFTAPVPDTAPGAFRGVDPIGQFLPRMKPFALDSLSAVRSAAPPALDSAAWAEDLAETRRRGAAGGPATPREDEDARFHTNPPPLYWARNLNRLARSQATLADNARLMALVWVAQADAVAACFETKYHYNRWRPVSAITASEPAWTPRVPTPNHPEYPAAHGCATGAMAESLAGYFGTRQVAFAFDSTVTRTTHAWSSVDEAVAEVREARIVGGMHFRTSNLAGERLGAEVARRAQRWLDEAR